MALKNPNRCIKILVLDKDVSGEAKRRGDNLSKVSRDLLRSYYFEQDDLEQEQNEINTAKKELEEKQKKLEIKKQKAQDKILIEPNEETPERENKQKEQTTMIEKKKPIPKKSQNQTQMIICPECRGKNVVVSQSSTERKCTHCGFNIKKENYEFVLE